MFTTSRGTTAAPTCVRVGLLAAALLSVPVGCSTAPADPPTPAVVAYQPIIVDVSGSVTETRAADGYVARASQVIDGAPDGTAVAIIVADGSALTTLCIPRTVVLHGDGPNRVQRQDDLAADRQTARTVLAEQLRCGRERATPGSDLLGALMAADRKAPIDGVATSAIVFSDGLQASKDLTLSRKLLTDDAAIASSIQRVESAGLLPRHLAGASLTITDPGAGATLTAAQAAGIEKFWSAYASAAGMTLSH